MKLQLSTNMSNYKRVFTVVIDSLGVGSENLEGYDPNANTLGHLSEHMDNFKIPNLQKMGIANLTKVNGVDPVDATIGSYAKMKEASIGKDTMTGHWEMMGLEITTPFQTFTDTGFPADLIAELEKQCGRKIVGNKAASGTEILDEFGEHEIETGDMIVYTSADSVLQICGNEETMGLDNLYKYCEIARELTMKPEWKVGRVIARPYTGKKKGEFVRTANRHDYALKPYNPTALNVLKDNNFDVISIGKIKDIFDGEGITDAYKSQSSVHGMEQTIEMLDKDFTGLCFTNLVDFDALWGHRRNPVGYGEELERFDVLLGDFLEKMNDDDLLIIVADHGNDPTYSGTDHTKEMVPFLAYAKGMGDKENLGVFNTFANVGVTVLDNFGLKPLDHMIGESVLSKLK